MKTLPKDCANNLYGQLSHTGKPFNCGYSITLPTALYYFASGEETERDSFLADKGLFDDETPNWETLSYLYNESFYYSEWFVEYDMDGGYDENGVYYIFEDAD